MVWINCFIYTQYECMVRTWWPGTEANFITKREALEFNCIMCLRTGLNERFRVIIYKRDTCVFLKQCRFRASCIFFLHIIILRYFLLYLFVEMNVESSRSHLIIGIMIESRNLTNGSVSFGKLSLVDLAGSERAAKTGAKDDQLKVVWNK